MRIAVRDHEPDQLRLIAQAMSGLGHECHSYTERRPLPQALRRQTFDLLVLEWSPPDMRGLELVKTARDETAVVEGLNAGADDFMVAPVRTTELEARVNALLRRSYPAQHETELVFGPYHLYPPARVLKANGATVELKNREYALALFLFQNLGRLLSREHLHEAVWGVGTAALSRSLDTHICRLRTKLGLGPSSGFLLLAIYGLGYRLEVVDASTHPESLVR